MAQNLSNYMPAHFISASSEGLIENNPGDMLPTYLFNREKGARLAGAAPYLTKPLACVEYTAVESTIRP